MVEIRSMREIALQHAVTFTRGTYDYENTIEDPFMGNAPRYIEPTVETQLLNAEKYLAFLEGDEVAE
jgi:hypothetical protein